MQLYEYISYQNYIGHKLEHGMHDVLLCLKITDCYVYGVHAMVPQLCTGMCDVHIKCACKIFLLFHYTKNYS